jgi:hypothetical protein
MRHPIESRGTLRQAEYEGYWVEAVRRGLVLVELSATRCVVVNVGPSRLDRNYDPIPGGSVAETDVGGWPCHYLRGSVVCGPTSYVACVAYIKDWLKARSNRGPVGGDATQKPAGRTRRGKAK